MATAKMTPNCSTAPCAPASIALSAKTNVNYSRPLIVVTTLFVHGPESLTAAEQWRFDRYQRLSREFEGYSRLRCLWRDQGCPPLLRPNLDRGSQGPSYSFQRHQPGTHRYAGHRWTTCRCHCADRIHHPDGTHWGCGRNCQSGPVSGVRRIELRHGY